MRFDKMKSKKKRITEMRELYEIIDNMKKEEKKPAQDDNTRLSPNLDGFIKILFDLGWLVKKNNNNKRLMLNKCPTIEGLNPTEL